MSNRSLRILDCLLFWSVIFCLLVVPQLIDNYWEDHTPTHQTQPTENQTTFNGVYDVMRTPLAIGEMAKQVATLPLRHSP